MSACFAAAFPPGQGVQIIVMRQESHDCGLTRPRFAFEIGASRIEWSGK
jgi:hypothetical protein